MPNSSDDLVEKILAERHEMQDWVSIADVLKVMGTTSFVASREIVQSVLDCVNVSDRLKLGRAIGGFQEIPKPLPVAEILDRIFEEEDAADRSFEMMKLFIDEHE